MGDNYEYLRGKIAERGPLNAKFSKDGFDRWAENTYPARAGQVEKAPTEMPSTTEARTGGKKMGNYMSQQDKMKRECSCSDDEEAMTGGRSYLPALKKGDKPRDLYVQQHPDNNLFYIYDRNHRNMKVGNTLDGYRTEAQAQADMKRLTGGSFLSALKKGAKTVGKYAKKAAKFVIKNKDTIKKGIETVREYAPVVRDVYKASKSKEGRKALLDAALGKKKKKDDDDEDDDDEKDDEEVEGGRQMTPLEYQMELEGPRGGALKRYTVVGPNYDGTYSISGPGVFYSGYKTEGQAQRQAMSFNSGTSGGSFLSALKKGAKTVGKYAKKAAKFVIKNKDTIKKGIETVREYAPVVRDVYKASKSKEGRKALLDAALGKKKKDDDDDDDEKDDDEVEGGAFSTGLTPEQERIILMHGGVHGGSILSALKKGAKTVGKYAKKAAKFVIKNKEAIKKGIETVREYAPVVRDVYKASKSKEGRKALLDAALGKKKKDDDDDDDEKDDDEKEGGAFSTGLTREQEQSILKQGGRRGKKPSTRGAIVSKVMREMGLSLPEASRYVKQNGLY